ncbi:hypothetical protein ACILEQ_08735, partial [Capnocytophaga canimorsus]
PISKRWVIERTFAWLDNDRRLCRNYELLLENSENMVKLSAIKFYSKKFKQAFIKSKIFNMNS